VYHSKANSSKIGWEDLDDVHLSGRDENTVGDPQDDASDIQRAGRCGSDHNCAGDNAGDACNHH
jgi:hypothetical protein